MDTQRAGFEVVRMARLLDVSRSGYYAWTARQAAGPSPAQQRRQQLTGTIRRFHADSDHVYGSPRILADLRADGERVSAKTVAKLMRVAGIVGISPRKFTPATTIPGPDGRQIPDLVKRRFDQDTLNAVWISDITYLPTDEGWLYLCAVRDGCSRRVLGWQLADHLRTDLVDAALRMAVTLRGRLPERVIFHADRGCQYTSAQLADTIAELGLVQSVGRTGVCWDNACSESFWSTVKTEYYDRHHWATKAEARQAVGAWIEDRYNRRRRHSAIGMISPVAFEHALTGRQDTAA
jgi:transposase InsO family protein